MKPITLRLRAFTLPRKDNSRDNETTEAQFIEMVERGSKLKPREQRRYDSILQRRWIAELKNRVPDWGVWGGQTLIFDTETLNIDRGQAARFGIAQLRGLTYWEHIEFQQTHKRPPTRKEMDALRETFVFYHPTNVVVEDENPQDAIAALKSYCDEKNYILMTQSEFIDKVFLRYKKIKGKVLMPMMVAGHNLAFDLGAITIETGFAETKQMYGGFSMTIADPKPVEGKNPWTPSRVLIKKIGVKKHRISCVPTDNATMQTHIFVDTLQLSKAVQGATTPARMDDLCEMFRIKVGDTGHYGKQEVEHFKPLTQTYVEYADDDVERTWQIYENLRRIYQQHNLSTPIDRIYSEASIGKAYFKELGIVPFLERNVHNADKAHRNLMLQTCGIAMETMAGARAECRCRLQVREGMNADFKSQYPTVNYLLGLQDLLLAERVSIEDGGSKDAAAQFLRDTTIDDLLSKDKEHVLKTWRGLRGFALIDPAGCVLPVRSVYSEEMDEGDSDREDGRGTNMQASAINVGVNRVASGPYIWVSFLDVLASKFMTGVCPTIIKTRVLIPIGRQTTNRIFFFGNLKYPIDLNVPNNELFKSVIDLRGTIKHDRDQHPPGSVEYNELDAMQIALKLIANSTSYGVMVQFDVDERKKQTTVDVYYGSQKTTKEARRTKIGQDGSRTISAYKAEKPGTWFAPWGPLITAGGRLLIAIAETLAKRSGIGYGMCDTDSMFFIRPINPITGEYSMSRAEFREKVFAIADLNGAFQNLNPYELINGEADAVFSVEDVNYFYERRFEERDEISYVKPKKDKDHPWSKTLKPLYILSVSAKRYALANITRRDGSDYYSVEAMEKDAHNSIVVLRKVSGHGLGHISAPQYQPIGIDHLAVPYKRDVPLYSDVCKGKGNPCLFLDMWHTAFTHFILGGRNQKARNVCARIDAIINTWQGLNEPQFQQRSLNTASAWRVYKNLPNRRPFQFFNVYPSTEPGEYFQALPEAEKKMRYGVSLYSEGGKSPDIAAMLSSRKGIYWNNDNRFASELRNKVLRLSEVRESMGDYFNRPELKSKGEYGVLDRHTLTIFDVEYIGKESNYLLEADVDDNDSSQIEDLAAVPLFRTRFNPAILRLMDNAGIETIADHCKVGKRTLIDTLRGVREDSAPAIMRHLRACVSFDPATSALTFNSFERKENVREKKVRETLKQLNDLYARFRALGEQIDDNSYVLMADAMGLMTYKPSAVDTREFATEVLSLLFNKSYLSKVVGRHKDIIGFSTGDEIEISFIDFKTRLNRVSGYETQREKLKSLNDRKTDVSRNEYNVKRKQTRLDNQTARAEELAEHIIDTTNIYGHLTPDKFALWGELFLTLFRLVPLFIVLLVIVAFKEPSIALKRAINSRKKDVQSPVIVFEDEWRERLTDGKDRRREQYRLSKVRARQKLHNPIGGALDHGERHSDAIQENSA